ncbi:MAG: SDR family oxidoreductase [Chloroflexi bacterium]|nr:SDR family oxidoreductase [Chloroflexota bacterium]
MEFTGKTAIVTGAANGIGRATAVAFGKAGANVAAVDIDDAGAKRVAAQIEDTGGAATAYQADLTKPAEIKAVVQQVVDTYGRVDALANVAAIYPRATVLEVTEEYWDRMMDLNLRAVFFCCQEALRVMLPQGSGVIVNIASGAAFRGIEGLSVYSAAKGGVVSLSRGLALEVARTGVRVNVVAPGNTDTDGIRANLTQEQVDAAAAELVSGRWMEPEEIAAAILFLCSDAASGINGAIINVNGGNYMI